MLKHEMFKDQTLGKWYEANQHKSHKNISYSHIIHILLSSEQNL
jgi:hypothetical protein